MSEIDVIERDMAKRDMRLLEILLSDKTTGGNIRWCTDAYIDKEPSFCAEDEMTIEGITQGESTIICPRVTKSVEEQEYRKRDRGEVFTPSWVCNIQNNLVDSDWFGREDVFNYAQTGGWTTTTEPISFPEGSTWKQYIDKRVLEITCGEAPYLASRYDTVTGEVIPIANRIGLLDRKFRVLAENAASDEEWNEWALRAIEATYGYDYQGDNVLLARENILMSFCDYYEDRFSLQPDSKLLRMIANRIAWNIWQMDAFTATAPYSQQPAANQSIQLDFFSDPSEFEKVVMEPAKCKIFNWRRGISELFNQC